MNSQSTEILYDARWIGKHGIGRFAGELAKALPEREDFQTTRRPWHPLDPALLAIQLWKVRPRLFFSPGYNSPLGWPKPFIFTLHDLHHLCVRDNSSAIKRAYYRRIIRPACHRAAFVLTVSEYSRREITAWAGLDAGRVINVGNGVGEPFVAEGSAYSPGFPYLLYVGSHKPHKNLPRLLQAYKDSCVYRDVRLILTGRPASGMLTQITELNLNEQVSFIDSTENERLACLYRGAVGLVFPSLYEGFGLPPLEAMSCGIPVLTSNVCSLPEVVGDAGIQVDPHDEEAIADGMRRLVYDSSLREQLRKQGLIRASQFTWDETARRSRAVLQSVLSSN